MPSTAVVFTERFKNDLQRVYSSKVYYRILNNMDLLQYTPEMGSTDLPRSIIERFGPNVRKLSIAPFLILYKLLPESDTVLVLGMVHQRQAR